MTTTINASTTLGLQHSADTSGILQLQTADTAALTINSSQNVGIGTISPAVKLDVNGTSQSLFKLTTTNSEANINFNINGSTNNFFGITGGANFFWNTGGTERMRIDSSGNIGIGTTSPAQRLDVQAALGRVLITSTTGTNNCLTGYNNTGGTAYVGLDSSGGGLGASYGLAVYHGGAYPIVFSTNATERARITSGGYFKASNSGSYVNATGDYHEFVTSGANTTVYAASTSATPNGIAVSYRSADPNGTGNHFLYCEGNAGTQRMSVRSNGGIANYSANNVNLSDSREKTNANPAGDYLAKICAIPVRTYNYIDQNLEEDDGLTLGVFAQDVQEVAPELVNESNWGSEEEPKMRLSIYQTDLQYALMKCIQEQQALITTLTERISALEAK